jgi:hypothetical protein
MKLPISAQRLALLTLVLGSAAAIGVACSSTNGNPMPDGGGGSSIVTASAVGGTTSSTGGTGGTTTTSTGAGGPTCYDGGSPMTTNDFLNPCEPSATCQTYPNSTLPGLTADGGLPPLQ